MPEITQDTNLQGSNPYTKEEIEKYDITKEQIDAASNLDNESVPANSSPPKKILDKFESQDELVKAYKELEKKFSNENENENKKSKKPETVEAKTSTDEDTTDSSTEEDTTLSEGAKNEFNELPDSAVKEAVQEALTEFEETGEIGDAVYDAVESLGISKEIFKEHLELKKLQAEVEIKNFYDSVGGQENFEEVKVWASTNLSEGEQSVFNNIVDNGTNQEISFAIINLTARHSKSTEVKPMQSNLIKADTISQAEGGYNTQAEMIYDMQNPEYANNPAYQAKVEAKAKRSSF